MNTDEHGLETTAIPVGAWVSHSYFIPLSSGFICVHLWLKTLCFNFLNRDVSMGASLGVCDAFVSA
jgi:hypothetical protein